MYFGLINDLCLIEHTHTHVPWITLSPSKPPPMSALKPTKNEVVVQSTNFFLVFTHWRLAIRAVVIFFIWIVHALVYYGISYLITSFAGNIFINNAIAGAMELPAYLLCFILLLWARKKSMVLCLLFTAAVCMVYPLVPKNLKWVQLSLAVLGKMAITTSFNLIYLITHELYPTSIRGAGLAFSSMIGRFGSISAPWIVLIAQKNTSLIWLAMVIFGVFGLAGGLLSISLPETQNHPLPETMDDAINYPPSNDNKTDETELEVSRL